MRRREFLRRSAGAAGVLIPALSFAQDRPCRPGALGVTGGPSIKAACGSKEAEADWTLRSTGQGVIWAHDFRSATELSNFAVYNSGQIAGTGQWATFGPDPGSVKNLSIVADGPTGSALEYLTPPKSVMYHAWSRPFSAVPGDRGWVDDGRLDYLKWRAASQYNQPNVWRQGLYGKSTYHSKNRPAGGTTTDWRWDGTDFYLQARVKISASAWDPLNLAKIPAGKLAFFDLMGGGRGEYLVQSPVDEQWGNAEQMARGRRRYFAYTGFGSTVNAGLSSPQGSLSADPSTAEQQPGGAFDNSCYFSTFDNCWMFVPDEWVTLLWRVAPGSQSPGDPRTISNGGDGPDWWKTALRDGSITVWAVKDSEIEASRAAGKAAQYTKVYEKTDLAWSYNATWESSRSPTEGTGPPAFNVFTPSNYMNEELNGFSRLTAIAWSRRWTQIIFSRQFIPCPQV
jgi:hypothetical protein